MEKNSHQEQQHIHSLQADLATGWKPKLKIIGPMPLNFDNQMVDKSILALLHQQSAFYSVVYLGPRPASTFQLHELMAKQYRFKYNYLLHNDFAHLRPYFRKFYSQFESETKRPYYGMNPNNIKKQPIFDSCFEGGNLDCAVRMKTNEYDLLLRIDSNTAGHVMWYYFRVKNSDIVKKTLRLNIVNLRRNKSAYQRGMRPFLKREDREWMQGGQNITVTEERIRYLKQNLSLSLEEDMNQYQYYRRLSFDVVLEAGESIQLAYSVPYLYSQLLQDIKSFKKRAETIANLTLQIDFNNQSLSGLQIPIIKIRQQSQNDKYCVFILCRQHPGQSNSSHVLKGSIQQLLSGSESSQDVLKYYDFVIVPMLNPDGVVAGNFRTSLFGKDLNRLFKVRDTTLLPEIQMARNLLSQLSQTYKKKLLLFLDYHGHSTRKNAFFLGPGIFDAQLLNDIRVLPKILSTQTEIFRYPSCSFRLDGNKKTTARALFGKVAGLSYTLETSNWSYYSKATGEVVEFTARLWQQLGCSVMQGVQQFLLQKIQLKKKYQNKMKEQANKKLKMVKSKLDLKVQKSITTRQKILALPKNKQLRTYTETIIESEGESKEISVIRIQKQKWEKQDQEKQDKQSWEEFRQLDKTEPVQKIDKQRGKYQIIQEAKENNSSDDLSEGGLDSQSEGQDMQQQKFKKYIKAASQMLIQFQKMYYGQNYRKGFSKYKINNNRSIKLLIKEKKKKVQPTQACLRPIEKKTQQSKQSSKFDALLKDTKKNIFFQEQILIRNSVGKSKNDSKTEQVNEQFRKLNLIEPSRKGKINVDGKFKSEYRGITEQLARFQKLQIINLQRSNQMIRKNQGSKQRLKNDSKSSNSSVGLPYLKSKTFLEEGLKSNSHILKNKSKDLFGEMLVAQKVANKNSVLNVLRLSRVQKEDSNF